MCNLRFQKVAVSRNAGSAESWELRLESSFADHSPLQLRPQWEVSWKPHLIGCSDILIDGPPISSTTVYYYTPIHWVWIFSDDWILFQFHFRWDRVRCVRWREGGRTPTHPPFSRVARHLANFRVPRSQDGLCGNVMSRDLHFWSCSNRRMRLYLGTVHKKREERVYGLLPNPHWNHTPGDPSPGLVKDQPSLTLYVFIKSLCTLNPWNWISYNSISIDLAHNKDAAKYLSR